MTTERKILVVDDEPANLELLIDILEESCEVVVAINGERGLRLAASTPQPDLVLLDVVMPGIDGFEVCQRLKDDPRTRGIPVIFLSARHEDSAVARGLTLGAVDYIAKPFNVQEVKACVDRHLAQPGAVAAE